MHFMRQLNQVYQKMEEVGLFTGLTVLKELKIYAFNMDARKMFLTRSAKTDFQLLEF